MAIDTTGCWFSWSMRRTSGSLTSRGKPGRTCAILSRTSCIARSISVAMRNSAKTSLRYPIELMDTFAWETVMSDGVA